MAIQFLNTVQVDTDVLYVDTSTSNVGIGTDNPRAKLDITNGSTGQTYSNVSGLLIDVNGTSNSYYGLIVGSSTGNSHLAVTNAGNVGIGTTSPNKKLEVSAATDTTISIASSDTSINVGQNIGILEFASNNETSLSQAYTPFSKIKTISESAVTGTGTVNGAITFETADANVFSEKMHIASDGAIQFNTYGAGTLVTDASGNITVSSGGGVGGPFLPLSAGSSYPLTGDLYISNATYIRNTDSNGAAPRTLGFSSSNTMYIGPIDSYAGGAVLYGVSANVASHTLYTSGSARMIINSSGNVGIGITAPTNYKLQIDGTVESSAFSVEGASARIFAPDGATYNGSGTETGYLIAKLPDNGAAGINNMMTGVIRVFDYAQDESFDVHFAGYWYSGYNWTNCSAWIDSSASVDRNFTVRFGEMTGSAGANTRPYITIGEATSTWFYCKFSVINYEPGHSNFEAYKWDSGWSMDISATDPGNVIQTKSNTQVNNWVRNGQDVYYVGDDVGIGTTSPAATLDVVGSGLATLFRVSNTEANATTKYGAFVGRHYTNSEENITGMLITSSSNSTQGGIVSIGGGISAANAVNNIILYTAANNTTTTGTERMRINNIGDASFTGNITVSIPDSGGSPAMANTLRLRGYEGRGAGIKIQDSYNSAASPSDREWFVGSGYSNTGFNIGYSETGSQSSYAAQSKLNITTSGNVGIGTVSPGGNLHVVGATGGSGSIYLSDRDNGTGTGDALLLNKSGTTSFIYNRDSGDLKLGTNNQSSYVTIKDDGDVGINNTSPVTKLHVSHDSAPSTQPALGAAPTSAMLGGTSFGTLFSTLSSGKGIIQQGRTDGTATAYSLLLNPVGGNVGIGLDDPASLLEIEGATNASTSNLLRLSRASAGSTPEKVAGFYSGTSGEKGYITVNDFGTAYNTSSDYRLKENIKPIEDSVERLMSLKPCNFNFISEDEDKIVVDGFIAHEAKEVVPEAVTGVKDAVDENGDPLYQGIDQAKLVPLLTAALQEAIERIKLLENKINN